MMGERSQSLILVKHLEDLEEKLRLYVKALRDGKNFSARKATDKERKLEEECLKELGIGEQSAPTRLDTLAQDLARYILTPKVDESGNLVYLYPDRPSGKRQKQYDRVPRAGKVPAHASALTMWEKTTSFLEVERAARAAPTGGPPTTWTEGPEREPGRSGRRATTSSGAPAVVVAQRLAARPGEGRAARAARPFHGGWLIMQGDIEACEVEEASVGVDRWRWAMPLHLHELELYAMDDDADAGEEPADVLDLTNCKVMNAPPAPGRLRGRPGVAVEEGRRDQVRLRARDDRGPHRVDQDDRGAPRPAPAGSRRTPSSAELDQPVARPRLDDAAQVPQDGEGAPPREGRRREGRRREAAANSFAAANKYMRRGVHSSTLSATPSLASRRNSDIRDAAGRRGSLPLGSLLRAAAAPSALSSRSRSRLGRNSTRARSHSPTSRFRPRGRYSSGATTPVTVTIVEASVSKPPSTPPRLAGFSSSPRRRRARRGLSVAKRKLGQVHARLSEMAVSRRVGR